MSAILAKLVHSWAKLFSLFCTAARNTQILGQVQHLLISSSQTQHPATHSKLPAKMVQLNQDLGEMVQLDQDGLIPG